MRNTKKYQIETMNNQGKTLFIVYATDIYSPSEFFSKLESELKRKNKQGDVFFDLIIPNGGKKDRYVRTSFNGEKFASYVLNKVTEIDEYKSLSEKSACFFKKNFEKVNTNLISKATSFALKQGIPI
ncbi:TPA_asm: antitoxin LsoB [Salmonella enterica]|uniref:Antitoxin LsoB n=1 Tax=Salmonella enterica TaxID=28901 RepID=A0A726XB82_SALER|nr:type II toxin-antitoxin system RnlB family antitoxin [Enterobacter hormaechei]EAU0451935.1 antitoxin LsoB [Salmonella enterica]EBQ2012815.1 antitoxin LsoB [Salmonella enterica subsp. enterica]ECS8793582.1 antitoxin LsoB [Salmonella enterica subsp. enterica serovar Senftenberg]ELK5139089.1 type II toxin-antitoxin system RnlB family antitoxin [Salmonella enterica subsp. enterica serovar Anatum]EBB4222572.1 antitoxin LsoB [Salmonella enterica]